MVTLAPLSPLGSKRTKSLCAKALVLSLASILVITTSSCKHNNTNGNHIGASQNTVNLVAALIGAAAEVGVLVLTGNQLTGALASAGASEGTKYLLDEFGLTCKACGNTSSLKGEETFDSVPKPVGCSNPECHRYVYMIVSQSLNDLNSALSKLRQEVPPTCLLTKEYLEGNSYKLTWYSYNASRASLNDERVSLNGSMEVHPGETTTYTLKVIGERGRSEDDVTINVDKEEVEADPEADQPQPVQPGTAEQPPPAQPPPPIQPPPAPRVPVTVYLNKVVVSEDGSVGATSWSFEVFLDGASVITLRKQTYHDDDRNTVPFSNLLGNGVLQGNDVRIKIEGHNFDDNRTALGYLTLPFDTFSRSVDKEIPVMVRENYKKGYFTFHVTIVKQN